MKDVLNARIKHREPFRPFAPSVLAESVGSGSTRATHRRSWCWSTGFGPRSASRARDHARRRHGRLQTVENGVNPRYYRLLREFAQLTGVPILLNTSFNESEPIVMSARDALETFAKTRIDLLVLGNHVLRRDSGFRGAENDDVEAAPD